MRFVVIGITDSPHPFFPPEVMEIIRRGKVFSGGKRHHEIVAQLLPKGAEWIDITVPLDDVFKHYQSHTSPIVVFASGDPLFFGFANTIRRRLPEAEVEVYPAFNSLQLLAHRLLLPYHDMRIASLTGRPWHEFDRALIERSPKLGVLTDREHTPAAIARRMLDYGYTYYNIYIGEHLGNPALEKVTALTLEEASGREFAMPNCVILSGTEILRKPFGIPESEFALLDGREKMITKMPIRLLTLQALDLPHRSVLWDIGACTGSVSIEARLQFPHLHIEAFEIRPECEAIIHENMRRHGALGISVHIGDFCSVGCDSIATHQTPDAVFIGGHGGHLKEIMARVCEHLPPGGVIVMNSVKAPRVTTDSHRLWDEACRELNLKQEPPLHIQLNDHHPITILKCKR
ncbi:MAG: precorrin-6y C5,15-methyltransferase (decarboxylating) subunit CbiE [Bacteroidaceae bacterium]|nr:precorrin-6y C5,15-methyltransferase (decarboxylating) subunit CbiE [Bacteroidaceae bacterium]